MNCNSKRIVHDILRLYQNGDSVADIVRKLHLPEPTVQHALEHGRLPEPELQQLHSE